MLKVLPKTTELGTIKGESIKVPVKHWVFETLKISTELTEGGDFYYIENSSYWARAWVMPQSAETHAYGDVFIIGKIDYGDDRYKLVLINGGSAMSPSQLGVCYPNECVDWGDPGYQRFFDECTENNLLTLVE